MPTEETARHTGGILITPLIIHTHIETSPYRPGHHDPHIHITFITNDHVVHGPQSRASLRDVTAIAPLDDTPRPCAELAKQLQDAVNTFPSRRFAGHIQATPEHGAPWRYTVNRRTRLVETVHPAVQLVWPGETLAPMGGTKGPSNLVRNLIAYLQRNPGVWFYGAQLARHLGVPAPSASNALCRLKERGFVEDEWDYAPAGAGVTRRHLFTITPEGMKWRA